MYTLTGKKNDSNWVAPIPVARPKNAYERITIALLRKFPADVGASTRMAGRDCVVRQFR